VSRFLPTYMAMQPARSFQTEHRVPSRIIPRMSQNRALSEPINMSFCLLAAAVISACNGASALAEPMATSSSGTIPACPTTPERTTSGTTTLSVAASRASGLAPLSVFFDATGTVSRVTLRPFHDIEYRWTFGEISGPGVARWSHGSRAGVSSRNFATGPIAAHVYETPGTYPVTVTDGAKTVSYTCQITVQNPDIVFAGARTACFSTSGHFDGCPSAATRVTTADFQAVAKWATASNSVRRLLMRRGEKWTTASTAQIAVPGPGLIGAFGAGARPVIATAVGMSEAAAISFSGHTTPTMKDWRLMDVSIEGSPNVGTKVWGIGAGGGIDQLTILRVNANAFWVGLLFVDTLLDIHNADPDPAVRGHHVWDQLSIVDMDITNVPHSTNDRSTGGIGTYFAGERVFYAGNMIDNAGTVVPNVSHVARFTYLGKAVISNNTLNRAGPTQHSIKLHAPAWGSRGVDAAGIGGGHTRWVVISDNKFVGGNGAWPVAVGPQDQTVDERGLDIILERNWHVAGPGTQWHQVIWFSDVTSRNNIIDMSGAVSHGGILVSQRAPQQPPANQVHIYNNTFYSPDIDNDFVAVGLHPLVTNVVAKNNLGYAPNDTYRKMTDGTGHSSAPLVQSNNTTNVLINPQFVGPLTIPAGFKIKDDSYAAQSGTFSSVYSDFFQTNRPTEAAEDIGAITK
jgi:hypothetical protein